MKKLLTLALLAAVTLAGCKKYDDSAIIDRLDRHEQRIADLEATAKSLQAQWDAGALIKSVTPLTGTPGGWRIEFTGGATASIDILNGAKGDTGATGGNGSTGPKGEKGDTPYIDDGYWWIGGVITGVKATGDDGDTPYIKDGNWWVGSTDTGEKAKGDDGDTYIYDIVEGDGSEEFPAGTITIILNDAEQEEDMTRFVFERASTAVWFEIITDGKVVIPQDGTGEIVFRVNPSTAWIPTTADGGLDKWTLDMTASRPATRASYEPNPADGYFTLVSIAEKTAGRRGEYIATIRCDYAVSTEEYVMALVLNTGAVDDPDAPLVSSGTFVLGAEPVPVEEGVVINGVTWATRNTDAPGAFAAKPEDGGMFFQWNRRTGWSSTNPMTSSPAGQTWDSTNAPGDSWAAENDPCPEGWRVPTTDEFKALCDTEKVTGEWDTTLKGHKFTDKTSNKSVFFPAAGYRYHSQGALYDVGSFGRYWSALPERTANGYYMFFNGSIVAPANIDNRNNSFSVRCVKAE